MKNWICLGSFLAAAAVLGSGCNVTTSAGKAAMTVTDTAQAAVKTMQPAYFEMEHNGRIYVIGDQAMKEKFENSHHLPYTDTRIGAGPMGETVVVQVDKKDPTLQERLWKNFSDSNLYYEEEEAHERIYVLGSASSHLKFLNSKHLPYAETHIGEGPEGQTVVVEIDKKNPHLQNRLWSTFVDKHLFYTEVDAHGRKYILGSQERLDKFKTTLHIPYANTLIGAGHDGQSLVFELDKKNPALVQRLMNEYALRNDVTL